jgi:Holliday junction resolvase-like predicted endonuclease
VAEQLARDGYEVIGQNWKTKVCEIDVIAKRDGIIYFTEVKYRGGQSQGDGLAYITPLKLRKLHLAANVWNQQYNWSGDYRLLAVGVTTDGVDYIIEEIIELE